MNRLRVWWLPFFLLGSLPDALAGADVQAESVAWRPFVDSYCVSCHQGEAAEAGLRLDEMTAELDDAATFAVWERVYDRVHSGEMPPSDADQPASAERSELQQQLGDALTDAHAAARGTVLRRLNRREYQNTLNDLFGTNLDLESRLPEDGRVQGFDNVGVALNVSMVQLQQYLEAIDAVMDAAIANSVSPPQPSTKLANYADTREGEQHLGTAWKQADDGAVVFFRALGYPTGMLRTANVSETGRYRVRVTGYAYQADQPVTFAVGGTTFQRGAAKPTFGYFSFPPGPPTTIEFEAWIEDRYMIEITPWGIADEENLIRQHGIDTYPGPGLAIHHVELHGPLTGEFPKPGHRLLFAGLQRREVEPGNPAVRQKSWYVPEFEIVSNHPGQDVRPVLVRVATAAFRRPVTDVEVAEFADLFDQQLAEGSDAEDALKTAVAAIFCAPEFLYLQEPAGRLDDYALAARLSYFLTRTAPDAELLQTAAAGRLTSDPAVLLRQARRLLQDARSQRFINDFTDAWLNLREIEFTNPDESLYPEFDAFLQYSMLLETRRYFEELITANSGVGNLVRSDFAMLNNRLAKHYDIEGVAGPDIRRVQLDPDTVRGGLLGQASILKVSANGTNTSPVVRGIWVLERLLGIHPSAPPPGISGIEPDIRGATTLRELLAAHRDADTCRSCHAVIDPPGFALESFDPIGGWRENFRSLGEGERISLQINGQKVRYRIGPPVDSSGQLPDGRPFAGFREFRDLLADDQDTLAQSLATKLLTFACGRPMGFSDRPAIRQLVAESKVRGHGVRDLIELVIMSELFQHK